MDRKEMNLVDCVEYAKSHGGWIAKTDEFCFWYSPDNTRSKIFSEISGEVEVGMFSNFLTKEENKNAK